MSATRRVVRLPRLKTSTRQVGEPDATHQLIRRGYTFPSIEEESAFPETNEDRADHTDVDTDDHCCYNPADEDPGLTTDSDPLPSLHEIKQKSKIAGWSTLRPAFITSIVQNSSMPVDQRCTLCVSTEATFRCIQCGPCAYYCNNCLNEWHSSTNIFHMPEEWKVVIS